MKSLSRRFKVFLVLFGGLVTLVAIFLYQVRAMEARALLWAEGGRDTVSVLGEISSGLKARNLDQITAVYAADLGETSASLTAQSTRTHDLFEVGSWREDKTGNGAEAVRSRYENLLSLYSDFEFVKFKLERIESLDKAEINLRGKLWMRGTGIAGQILEDKIRYQIQIQKREEGWKITKERFVSGTNVRGPGQGFVDVAAEAGIDYLARQNPMYDTPEWTLDVFGIFKYSSAGVTSADYNGDGHVDLFFADGAAFRLYRNLGDGTFTDATAEAGLPVNQPGINAALFADLDNDGDQDLVLGGLTVSGMLFENSGEGRYIQRPITMDPLVTNVTAADVDNDGDLDLYLGRYLDPREDLPTTLIYTRNSAGNALLQNDGNFNFSDVTERAGLREGGLTLGIAWADYDEDGDQDVYVANDFGRNAFLRNRGDGTFEDISLETGTFDFGFGMSATWADADNDGDLDIYVSNVNSSQRWYSQSATLYKYLINSVRQGTIDEDFGLYREIVGFAGSDWHNYGDGMVKGNSLFLNDGQGGFTDVSETANANPLGWYWGSTIFDYDNDGHQDIYAANGWITGHVTDDL